MTTTAKVTPTAIIPKVIAVTMRKANAEDATATTAIADQKVARKAVVLPVAAADVQVATPPHYLRVKMWERPAVPTIQELLMTVPSLIPPMTEASHLNSFAAWA